MHNSSNACTLEMSGCNYVTKMCFCFQDKAQPDTQARVFGSVSFNALLAVDDPEALSLVRQPGSDGFRLDSTPLFQVSHVSGSNNTTSVL